VPPIRFQHPGYNPDQAQKLISSSMSRHLSTRNISSKFTLAFLSNLAHRQTDKQTDRQTNEHGQKTYTFSFVGGKKNIIKNPSITLSAINKQANRKYYLQLVEVNVINITTCTSHDSFCHKFRLLFGPVCITNWK